MFFTKCHIPGQQDYVVPLPLNYLLSISQLWSCNYILIRGVARISQRGVLNSADAFSADKFFAKGNVWLLSIVHTFHCIIIHIKL